MFIDPRTLGGGGGSAAQPQRCGEPAHCNLVECRDLRFALGCARKEEVAVLSENERAYHSTRARAELDCARSASSQAAADLHVRLSALHMGRLKEIDEL